MIRSLVRNLGQFSGISLATDKSSIITNNKSVRQNIDQNHNPDSDLGTFPNFDVPRNHGPHTDENIVSNLRMTMSPLLTCAAMSNVVKDQNVVTDARRLTDNNSSAIVK